MGRDDRAAIGIGPCDEHGPPRVVQREVVQVVGLSYRVDERQCDSAAWDDVDEDEDDDRDQWAGEDSVWTAGR